MKIVNNKKHLKSCNLKEIKILNSIFRNKFSCFYNDQHFQPQKTLNVKSKKVKMPSTNE